MRNIEEQIGVSEASSKGFRADVTSYMFYLVRNGMKIDYTSYEPLKEAIEKKLMASVKDLSRIITKTRVRDKEQNEKYDAMVEEKIGDIINYYILLEAMFYDEINNNLDKPF